VAQTLHDLGFNVPRVTEPLATIEVGRSLATVVRDPQTGAASTDGSAAQVASVSVSEEDLGVLSEVTDAINEGLAGLAGNPLNCDLENPLADLVCIDLGEVREQSREQLDPLGLDFGEGTVGIQSSAATVRVLRAATEAIGGDLATLQLATATAAANAVPVEELPAAPAEPAAPPQPEGPRDLPRTGADGLPLGVLAGMLGLAVVGGALVRRTALS
jgi:LPXTG-motif cell wall-anchored protein